MLSKPLLASVLRVNSQLAHTRRIETNNGFFSSRVKWLESAGRYLIDRVMRITAQTIPQGGKLTDLTTISNSLVILIAVGIEQLVKLNVVSITNGIMDGMAYSMLYHH
jgi:hypothetical protein